MNPKHQAKIQELVGYFASTVVVTAQRLYSSGGIDVTTYDEDQYALSKILVSAAIEQHMKDFYPLHSKEHMEDMKNIAVF